ncbi:MAG TPA: glycosyl transferase family 2 [Lachnospiraceae bacterium]|nr:glycosyl transferase family 2 [Lachnospiraceae bacterium]
MVSISVCMIVKNEERILGRCLSCLADLADEIIIVDTGSEDKTKKVAAEYTDKIYDFQWTDDFSAARNFAFSKATGDYIYSADADEILDEENRERFRILKENMLPEIEIVQMYYTNQLKFRTIYNFDKEYRPKLFKRVRSFTWIEPVHETVRTDPVVFDSDIEIIHEQEENHAKRDLEALHRAVGRNGKLSGRLFDMYARELYFAGDAEDFRNAEVFFEGICTDDECSDDELKTALCIMVKAERMLGNIPKFFKYAMKAVTACNVSEMCLEMGDYYMEQEDYEEASVWFYNAAYETESIFDARSRGSKALNKLAECCRKLGIPEKAEYYEESAREWSRKSGL